MNIIIMGPQGSGKSTQAKLLAERLDLVHVSTGEIVRESCNDGDLKIAAACEASEEGILFPDELITKMLKNWLIRHGADTGIVLEGYPRTVEQVPALEKFKLPDNGQIDHVVYINTSEKECLRRLTERAKIEQRADETPEAIRTRLNLYHTKTVPILDYYRQKGILIEVDGDPGIEEIRQEILTKLTECSIL